MTSAVRIAVGAPTDHLATYLRAWSRRAALPVKIEVIRSPQSFQRLTRCIVVLELAGRFAAEPVALPLTDEPVFVLLDEDQPVAPGWIEILQQRNVVMTVVRRDMSSRYISVVAGLERYLHLDNRTALVQSVVRSAPQMSGLSDYVTTVIENPWTVRRPRDLAQLAHTNLSSVKRRCASAGFQRIEHFITLTRWLGLQHLLQTGVMPAWRANVVVGIDDPSNFRLQLRRTSYVMVPSTPHRHGGTGN